MREEYMSDNKKKKNKKSFDKNKSVKATPVKKSNVLEEWFFMSRTEIDVAQIKEVLEEIEGAELEVWKEMGVIECNIPDKMSMDMEQLACDLQDEESNTFLNEHNVKTLFAVSIQTSELELARPVLEKVANAFDGFFCGDTEDFEPVIG